MVEKDPRTHAIIGAAMEVHRHLGSGFLEAVYQEALAVEMTQRGVPFEREVVLPIRYKGIQLLTGYRADFVCFQEIIVELKALHTIGAIEHAQIIHYLKATEMRVGLLLNFANASLEYKRFVR